MAKRAINICGLALVAVLIGCLWSIESPAKASVLPTEPSFDCAQPSELDSVICGDPELSAADRRMAVFYRAALAGALGARSNQLITQRK